MLELKELQKSYGEFRLNVSMQVLPGQIVGLVGANGAGKSTTFKAALGLIRANAGQVCLFGEKLSASGGPTKQQKRRLGVVLSDSGFSGYLTVTQVADILETMYPKFEKGRFREYCGRFDLPPGKQIREFSTGMKAKLKTAAVLCHQADLLILDEPTAGLDVLARDSVLGLLRDYMEEKEERAILISSHISSDLENLCDSLYMIDRGRIVLHEDTDVLLSEYAVLKVSRDQYETLDRQHLLRIKREPFGYMLLTGNKKFYLERYPDLVIENGNIDDLMMLMLQGEAVV